MKRALAVLAVLGATSTARADEVEQSNQMMFGVVGSYLPQESVRQNDILAIGHYVAYSHRFDHFFVGVRAAISYGWLPSGDPGQQWLLSANALLGGHFPIGKRFALRGELGLGPLLNGGEGFGTQGIAWAYVRAAAQLTVVKSVAIEAFAGPSFFLGQYAVGVYPELGLGVGWNF